MHTTCFNQHWSSSGVFKIVDETAVLPSVNSILTFKTFKVVKSKLHVRWLTNRKKEVMYNRMLQYSIVYEVNRVTS
jgi:hypothetical protein